jgi:hypothetical protein
MQNQNDQTNDLLKIIADQLTKQHEQQIKDKQEAAELRKEDKQEAAELRKEAAKLRKEDKQEAALQLQALTQRLDETNNLLACISKNIIQINDKVISDFEGITEETKENLQRLGAEMIEHPDFIIFLKTKNKKTNVSKTRISSKGKYDGPSIYFNGITSSEIVKQAGLENEITPSAFTRWVNGILDKLIEISFHCGWPTCMIPFINEMFYYYTIERKSVRKS